ncbi:hypothetical protein BG004_005092 [Podila humilis]|nr:hypothetical protein BG004_005092 [Podila humilis]
MCSSVGLPSRQHLLTLAIVSRNDYGRNVHGLGLATNAAIVKAMPSNVSDVEHMVALYCANNTVLLKNTDDYDFSVATRVFVRMEQTQSHLEVPDQPGAGIHVLNLRDRFYNLQERHKELKTARANKTTDEEQPIYPRHKPGHNWIPYRTVEPLTSSGDPRALTSTKRPRPRYSYSTFPDQPARTPPNDAKSYRQLKRKAPQTRTQDTTTVDEEEQNEDMEDDDEETASSSTSDALGIDFAVAANYLYVNLGQLAPGESLSRLMVRLNSAKRGHRTRLQVASIGHEPEKSPKHYGLTGTFRTNGLVLQVLAYDLRIVKRHDPVAAPGRIDPQTGPDRWLREIRNEFKSQDDVEWTFVPYFESTAVGKDVWIVGVDFGQTCTAAISVRIPPQVPDQAIDSSEVSSSMLPGREENEDHIMYTSFGTPQSSADAAMDIDASMTSSMPKEQFRNLVIKSKALYQPQFRHRRHAEDRKTDEMRTAERSIEPHRGVYDDKVLSFVQSRLESKATLGLTSSSKQARTRGFAVTGINEYYSSQKCPLNDPVNPDDPCDHGFIARKNTRRCYCTKCWMYFHRDIMAAQNMIRTAQGHLVQQGRPVYLQPTDGDGNLLWQQENTIENQ